MSGIVYRMSFSEKGSGDRPLQVDLDRLSRDLSEQSDGDVLGPRGASDRIGPRDLQDWFYFSDRARNFWVTITNKDGGIRAVHYLLKNASTNRPLDMKVDLVEYSGKPEPPRTASSAEFVATLGQWMLSGDTSYRFRFTVVPKDGPVR